MWLHNTFRDLKKPLSLSSVTEEFPKRSVLEPQSVAICVEFSALIPEDPPL